MKHFMFPLLLSLLLVPFLPSCSSTKASVIPESRPLGRGESFSGVWYSKEFESMYLTQSGDYVSGVFSFKNGGTISGNLKGNVLTFDWEQPGDKNEARRTVKGRGYLALGFSETAQQPSLTGEWGYNDEIVGGGPWTATYQRPRSEDDPTTVKQVEKSSR